MPSAGEGKECNHPYIILGVTFDPNLSFERHIWSVAASASQRIGIMRRGLKIFDSVKEVYHCFNSFLLPVLEYASVVWGSAANIHLALLDRIVNRCVHLMNDVVPCKMNNRRSVADLCMLYKVRDCASHPLFACLPDPYRGERFTRRADALLSSLFVIEQISILGRSFLHLLTSGIAWVTLSLIVWALAALKLWSTVLCLADHFTFLFCLAWPCGDLLIL